MEIRIDYKSGVTRLIDTNTFTNRNPSFIRNIVNDSVLPEQCEILMSEIRLRWDLIEQVGLLAEIYYWDNNLLESQHDQLNVSAYDNTVSLKKAPFREGKVLCLITSEELSDVIKICEDDVVRYWRDIDGNLMSCEGVQRVDDNQKQYAAIAAAYKYLFSKYRNEHGERTKEIAEIENLLGISHEELAEIVGDEIRMEKEALIEQANLQKFTKLEENLDKEDSIVSIKENDQVKYSSGDR